MNKILYVIDKNDTKEYLYNISEDTLIYHFSINSSCDVKINMVTEGAKLTYYYSNINYDNNKFNISVNHLKSDTYSEVINHGVNVTNKKLEYNVCGIVPKESYKCICNQDNQIINKNDGSSIIKPNLLIDNYDVDANHGAYIGKFSEDKLFYLMSRGLSREASYRLLLQGFLLSNKSIELAKIEDFIKEIEKI